MKRFTAFEIFIQVINLFALATVQESQIVISH